MYLVRRTHSVKRGETILIRAARPTLVSYTAAREDLLTASRELFEVVQIGAAPSHKGRLRSRSSGDDPPCSAARPASSDARDLLRLKWSTIDVATPQNPAGNLRTRFSAGA
jgi:hypothetical protein